jgi:hypothetical protein
LAGADLRAGAAWVIERLPSGAGREEARAIWLEAMQRPGLLAPPKTSPTGSRDLSADQVPRN